MSITEWVINTYTKDYKLEDNLEAAKNFTFIWAVFEHMAKQRIFHGDALKYDEFNLWTNSLEFIKSSDGISELYDPETGNSIDQILIGNIDRSFNHFYQKYLRSNEEFINILYNQDLSSVMKEKQKFQLFMTNIDKEIIQNKIVFLFFVTKRIRNKFFHGIKSIAQVSQDYKEFEECSEYLIAIISLIERYSNYE